MALYPSRTPVYVNSDETVNVYKFVTNIIIIVLSHKSLYYPKQYYKCSTAVQWTY